jgi:signal transduction histidine kinase
MRYRAALIGASFEMRKRDGGGTAVVCAWRKNA